MKRKLFFTLSILGFLLWSPATTHAQQIAYNAGTSISTIDPSTGALTPISGSPFLTGYGPGVQIVHPSGKFGYGPNGNSIAGYTINASTGVLAMVPGAPFSAPWAPQFMAIDSTGKFLYALNADPNLAGSSYPGGPNFLAYAIDQTSGALSPLPMMPPVSIVASYVVNVAADPVAPFLYATGCANQWSVGRNGVPCRAIVRGYLIGTDGSLTEVPGSPFSDGTALTTGIAVDPAGKFVFVMSELPSQAVWAGPQGLVAYRIDPASGALSQTSTAPFTGFTDGDTLQGGQTIAIDPSGAFVYVAGTFNGEAINAYSFDPNSGVLTPVPGSPFSTPNHFVPYGVYEDRSGQFLYVPVNSTGTVITLCGELVEGFRINRQSGALSPLTGSPFNAMGCNRSSPAFPGGFGQMAIAPSSGGTPPPPPPPPPAAVSIFPTSATPDVLDVGADSPVELGLSFTSDTAGYIHGVRFYKSAANTGTHVGNLWSSTGTLLASATFTNETASGWQQANFANPVAITANTVYVASYHSTIGHWSASWSFFASSGMDNAPLHALANMNATPDGPFTYGSTSQFPQSTHNAANYWVDVVFGTTPQ